MKRTLNEIEIFRAQELLLQRATEGLDEAEALELVALGADEDYSFDLAAAAVDIATLKVEEMPIGVADKILTATGVEASRTTVMPAMQMSTLAGFVPPRPISTTVPPFVTEPAAEPVVAPSAPRVAFAQTEPSPAIPFALTEPVVAIRAPVVQPGGPVVGMVVPLRRSGAQPFAQTEPLEPLREPRSTSYAWIAAAASVALAAGAVVWATQREPEVITKEKIVEVPVQPPVKKELTASEARAELLASQRDVTTLAWTPTKDPNGAGATGDVVWSASAQRGYMRFVGLKPNDLKRIQYQLWIFDKDRDQAYPVDGGVFDVSSTGEVVVPITARLKVNKPVLFAVTIEKPGGVVVSKRERIVVTAAPKA